MPRRRVKLSPSEKALAAEIRREQVLIRRESKAQDYRLSRDKKDLKGKGASLLRYRLGNEVVGEAVTLFGPGIVERAARAMDDALVLTQVRREKRVARIKSAMLARGLSDEQISRYRDIAFPKVKIPLRQIFPTKKAKHYVMREYRNGKWRDVPGKRYKTVHGARSGRLALERLKARARIADGLGITLAEAKKLARDVEARALKALAKFRKTDVYKRRSERWKHSVTERKWKAASIAALYELMGVVFES